MVDAVEELIHGYLKEVVYGLPVPMSMMRPVWKERVASLL